MPFLLCLGMIKWNNAKHFGHSRSRFLVVCGLWSEQTNGYRILLKLHRDILLKAHTRARICEHQSTHSIMDRIVLSALSLHHAPGGCGSNSCVWVVDLVDTAGPTRRSLTLPDIGSYLAEIWRIMRQRKRTPQKPTRQPICLAILRCGQQLRNADTRCDSQSIAEQNYYSGHVIFRPPNTWFPVCFGCTISSLIWKHYQQKLEYRIRTASLTNFSVTRLHTNCEIQCAG